jgi:hypothetical protein
MNPSKDLARSPQHVALHVEAAPSGLHSFRKVSKQDYAASPVLTKG